MMTESEFEHRAMEDAAAGDNTPNVVSSLSQDHLKLAGTIQGHEIADRVSEAVASKRVTPLDNWVLVRRVVDVMTGGVALPDSVAMKQGNAEVLKVGQGRMMESGTIARCKARSGDMVLILPGSLMIPIPGAINVGLVDMDAIIAIMGKKG